MKQSTSKLLDTIALYVFTLAIAGVGVVGRGYGRRHGGRRPERRAGR